MNAMPDSTDVMSRPVNAEKISIYRIGLAGLRRHIAVD